MSKRLPGREPCQSPTRLARHATEETPRGEAPRKPRRVSERRKFVQRFGFRELGQCHSGLGHRVSPRLELVGR